MASKAWLSDLPPAVEKRMRKLTAEASPCDPAEHRSMPPFYLQRFGSDDGQLVTVIGDQSRVGDARQAGVIRDWYQTADGAAPAEQAYALIDNAARHPFTRFVQGDPYPVSKSDRAALSLWLAALSVRGPARAATTGGPALDGVTDRASARAALIDLGRQPSDSDAEDFFHLTQSVEDQTAESLHRALHLEVMFSKRFWTLLRFATPGLVTCDRPLRVFKGGDPWPDTGPALAAADEIWLPLDRSTAVILHSNSLVGEKVTDAPANFPVDNFNQEVIANAVQEIYCHPADYERVAQLQLARRS